MAYFRGYIFDLDGTIYLGENAIPGAPEKISELREQGCGVVFLSNKPLQPREVYAQKLTRLGIPASPEDVINSSLVLAQYLVHEMAEATVFVIGEQPLLDEMAAAGLSLSDDPEEIDVVNRYPKAMLMMASWKGARTFEIHTKSVPDPITFVSELNVIRKDVSHSLEIRAGILEFLAIDDF